MLIAGGKITTSGGDQQLTTADPFGADLLMLAGSGDSPAISVGGRDATFGGVLVAAGGIDVWSQTTSMMPALVGQQIHVGGRNHTIDGR